MQEEPSAPPTQPAHNSPTASPTGSKRNLIVIGLVVLVLLIAGGVFALGGSRNKSTTPATATKSTPAAPTNTPASVAKARVLAISSQLEVYKSSNSSYPSTLTTGYTAPAGTTFTYTPAPAGCTSDKKDCTSYTLVATNTSDKSVIVTKKSTDTN